MQHQHATSRNFLPQIYGIVSAYYDVKIVGCPMERLNDSAGFEPTTFNTDRKLTQRQRPFGQANLDIELCLPF